MRSFALLLAATSMIATPLTAQDRVEMAAEDVLQPYYAKLKRKVELPVAPRSPELPGASVLTRIAVGSCNQENNPQHMWAKIAAENPQAFLFIGDNVYGDTGWDGGADLATLRASYTKQSTHREFIDFAAKHPILATWDDHDFGFNDGGATFAHRKFAEDIFETYWRMPEDVRARDGVHYSRIYGPEGQRVQVIMLDTRFFRSNLRRPGPGEEAPKVGRYLPSENPAATMLGDDQWAWLERELAKPADVRIVVSSIQVITTAHGWEAWYEFPAERKRLLEMLGQREDSGLVILSGDRHSGGIYQLKHGDETMTELTASSLNLAFGDIEENTKKEPDPDRITPFFGVENFGLVDLDWKAKRVTVTLKGNENQTYAAKTYSW
jgi:alkaline phosphatase D